MLYLRHAPRPPLGQLVEYLWLLSDAPLHAREHIVPSGTLELVFNLSDDQIRIYDRKARGACERFSGGVVSGAYGRFFVIDPAVHALMIGVHFRPGGARPVLRVPSDELADAHVDLESLWGLRARSLRERLGAASTHAERFRLLEDALLAGMQAPTDADRRMQAARDCLGRGLSVRATAAHLGLSHRRFIEVFGADTGMTPKLFGRVQRFQRVLRAVERSARPSWAGLSLAHGYFDQSHLIRDFVAFAGLTPAEYARRRSQLVKENHVALT